MKLNGTDIVDTFAEAFPAVAARVVVTAESNAWCQTAAQVATGNATSVIACDCEAGVERYLDPDESPDGRPGVSLLLFAFNREKLEKALIGRVGQCILTCAGTACYDGLPLGTAGVEKAKRVKVGASLRYFGDTFQIAKKLEGRRYWRIPTMDGEFVCEDRFGTLKGVAGGNFLIIGESLRVALAAAERAVAAIRHLPEVILPFPGGIVRSGSKVGSRYPKLSASTNDAYCPTLRGVTATALPAEAGAVYEIVIDGLTLASVTAATRAGIQAACGPGILQITAGNYGGKLGPHHIKLHEILAAVYAPRG